MSINIPSHFVTQFSSDVELLLQQNGSKLRPYVDTGTHQGEFAAPINQIGTLTAHAPAGRFAQLNRDDVNVNRRWVAPKDQEVYQILDNYDVLRLIEDPKPKMAEAAANALGVAIDQEIIASAFGTALTGKSGTTSESFDTAFSIATTFDSAAASGLSVAKLVQARKLMEAAFVDMAREPLTLVISAKEHADLLNQVEVTSMDFNTKPVLVQGRVTEFLGFNIVVSEYLTVASSERSCIAYVKSGLYLGMWSDVKTRMGIREDLSSKPNDIYVNATFGATRTQNGKVVRILTKST